MLPNILHILANKSFFELLWEFLKANWILMFGTWERALYTIIGLAVLYIIIVIPGRFIWGVMKESDKQDSGFWPWWFS